MLLLAGALRKFVAVRVRKEEHRWKVALYLLLRIQARSTDPEAWKIEYPTSLRGEG